MKGKLRYILAFLVFALLGTYAIWKYTFRESDKNVASEKPDYAITASGLLEAFEKDEVAANTLYLDKVLLVSGTVESVTPDTSGVSVYLKESDALSGVICSFDKKSIDTAIIKKGLQASVKGICTGYLMDVVMNKCSMEPVAK